MARQKVGFVHEHIEKVVLGLCVVLLLGAAVFSFGGFRFSIDGKSPGGLCDEAQLQAEALARSVQSARPKTNNAGDDDDLTPAREELARWFGESAEKLVAVAGIEREPVRTQPFPPLLSSITGMRPEDRHNLARIVPPGKPIVTTGRSALELPEKLAFNELTGAGVDRSAATQSERSWVLAAAQVDLVAQDVNFRAEKYPAGSYLTVVAVRLQRKDETEQWRDWEDVNTYVPFQSLERPSLNEPADEIETFRRELDQGSEWVARTPPPRRRRGDTVRLPAMPYLDKPPKQAMEEEGPDEKKRTRDANRLASKWVSLAKKAMDAKPGVQDLDAALMLIKAALGSGASMVEKKKAEQVLRTLAKKLPKSQRDDALNEPARTPEKLMPLTAMDLDARVGHTYRYRMQYEVWNRFAGIPGELKDPSQAEQLTVLSGWSQPSRPVEIKSDVYFYLAKADGKQKEATVTIYRKTRMNWKSKDYKIRIGEEIGRDDKIVRKADFRTGAVCVDIVEKDGTVALVYLDTHSGILRERLLSVDKKDRFRKKLNGMRNGRG